MYPEPISGKINFKRYEIGLPGKAEDRCKPHKILEQELAMETVESRLLIL